MGKLNSSRPLVCVMFWFMFCSSLYFVAIGIRRTPDGSEEWGYVEVRPKAHMFWWLYRSPQRVVNGATPWPTILWLQGGPGGSGVAIGNFEEVGPLDTDLKPRNSTWLQKADLLFVDNPVGTGFSFVEDEKLFVKTDWEAGADLTTLLRELYSHSVLKQESPLFIVAESYGGKFAVTLSLCIIQAIKAGNLKLNLGGVALGDTWISPEDFVFSWGPLLLDMSRLDKHGAEESNRIAEKIRQQIKNEQYADATELWGHLEDYITSSSNGVDFYNILLDSANDPVSSTTAEFSVESHSLRRYLSYLSSKALSEGGIDGLMNGIIKEKLQIIPKNISWGGQSSFVFSAFAGDFMKPRIKEVDELLSLGVNVTIYSGQLDLICATKGTEAWVEKLKWNDLKNFSNSERKPLYCGSRSPTKGFLRSYKNLHFYWIFEAGHFVPVDQPCLALQMIADITQSPAAAVAV